MNLMLALIFAATAVATNETTAVTAVSTNGTTEITSATTYYDRKNGFAIFGGGVSVVDGDYRLHANRAFVFTEGTNGLNRIVALGNVALTNGLRTASGDKAVYYRGPGMVILSSTGEAPAEVRDGEPGKEQVLRGRKIRFWTGLQQVEVLDAQITAPSGSVSGDRLRSVIGR